MCVLLMAGSTASWSGLDRLFKPVDIPNDVLAFVAQHFPLFDVPDGLFEDVSGGTPAPRVLSAKDVRCVALLA